MVECRAAASPTDKSRSDGALPTVASEKPSCPSLLSYYASYLIYLVIGNCLSIYHKH